MKPSRSKREGRADRAREIQRGRRGARRSPHPRSPGGGVRGRLRARTRALLPGAAPATGWVGRHRPAGRGSSGQAGPPTGGSVGEPTDRPRLRRPPDRGRDDGPRLPARLRPRFQGRVARPTGEPRPPRPFSVAAGRTIAPGSGRCRPRYWRPGSAGDCREPCRPVLKHGPRSLSGPRVGGPQSEAPRRNESEGRSGPAEAGSGRAAAGAPPPCHEPTAAVAEEERAR